MDRERTRTETRWGQRINKDFELTRKGKGHGQRKDEDRKKDGDRE